MNASNGRSSDRGGQALDDSTTHCRGDTDVSKAIDDAHAHITDLETTISAQAGKKAELTTEITGLNEDLAANVNALKMATAIGMKEAAEFHDRELHGLTTHRHTGTQAQPTDLGNHLLNTLST